MTYREEYLKKFDALERSLDADKIPAGFEAMGQRLRDKLQAEKERYLAQFTPRDSRRTSAPSMGVVELTTEKTENPGWFFGSDLRSRNRVRLTLNHASVDMETQKVFTEGVVAELVMSEKQFADVILNLDWGQGFPVTQWTRLGKTLKPATPDEDPTKQNFQKILSGAVRAGSLSESIQDIREAIQDAETSGRIAKREAETLASNLESSVGLLAPNTAHSMERISEEYSKRVNEASMVLHIDARTSDTPLLLGGE